MKTRFLTAILAAAMGVQGVCAAPTNMPPQDLVGMSINTNTLAISGVNSNTWPQIQASNNIAKATVVTVVSNEVDALQAQAPAWDRAIADSTNALGVLSNLTFDVIADRNATMTNNLTLRDMTFPGTAQRSPKLRMIHHGSGGWVTNEVYGDASGKVYSHTITSTGETTRELVENGTGNASTLFGAGIVPLTYLPGLWDAAALTNVLALARVSHVTTLSGSTSAVPTAAAVSNRIDRINRLVYQARLTNQLDVPEGGTNVTWGVEDVDVYNASGADGASYCFDTNHVGKIFDVRATVTMDSAGAGAYETAIVEDRWTGACRGICGNGTSASFGKPDVLEIQISPTNGQYIQVCGSLDSGASTGSFSAYLSAGPALWRIQDVTNATMLQIFERR